MVTISVSNTVKYNYKPEGGSLIIIIDYQDRRPIYEQVTEKFRMLIYQEALPAGSRLPSVRQLAMELSINPNTIQRAYAELEQEGLIYPVKGRGNFVADANQILKIKREDYRKELRKTVQKAELEYREMR